VARCAVIPDAQRDLAAAAGGVRTLKRAATILLAFALVAGCGGVSSDPSPTARAAAARSACAPGEHQVAGAPLHLPPGTRPGTRLPLVIGLHGAGGTGADFQARTALDDAADDAGFATVYPSAASSRHFWSLNRAMEPDDVPRIEALLDQLEALGCIDPDRVFATGVSNGGGFAARLGCELADRLAGVAPVAGGYRALDDCPAGRRTSLLEIHGLADDVVPYLGLPPDYKGHVPRFVSRWAQRDGCAANPTRTHPSPGVTRLRYRGCDGGTAVEHVVIEGLRHGWVVRGEPADVDADEAILAFFRGKRRAR
jgi:polyhydroxybutyrate depolymerase